MKNSADTVLKEVVIGILTFGIVVQMILIILSQEVGYRSIGLWVGTFTAIGIVIHMKRSIEDALDLGEDGATKHVAKSYAFRILVVLLVFGTVVYFKLGSIFTTFIGFMGLKISAYLQPYIHKILFKFTKSK
ncbi:MAG: hypothetical protein RSA90_06570 [Lachnospiraceae bacterium]